MGDRRGRAASREAVRALGLGLVLAGVLGLAVAAGREVVDGVGVVVVGGPVELRGEEAGEVPARGREREDLLAAAGEVRGEEGADEVGLEGVDEALAYFGGGHLGGSLVRGADGFILGKGRPPRKTVIPSTRLCL